VTAPPSPFTDRLALARRLVAKSAPTAPIHIADQLGAADREVRQLHDRLAAVLPMLEPARQWRQRMDAVPSDDIRAYLLAALLGCTNCCPHLRRGGPRPALARLPLGRVGCERCVGMLYRPSSGDDDRCDICMARGVATFHPFAVGFGPVLLAGDACSSCAGVLGIREEVAS
jgi:hypothetical protein